MANIITKGIVPKYGFDIDFKNINSVILRTAYTEYIGGIDSNGHERKDNFSKHVETEEIYFSEFRNTFVYQPDYCRGWGDIAMDIENALNTVQEFLDKSLNDRDKTVIIKHNDGKEEYIDANKLLGN